ncbi:hypothetical protein DENSPDRAFT_855588 [Dentipellis sp. KUC8613]|nr:hypothetical protein DENSPDRAFT_855588 [Dentipellis sp. KUC8613]
MAGRKRRISLLQQLLRARERQPQHLPLPRQRPPSLNAEVKRLVIFRVLSRRLLLTQKRRKGEDDISEGDGTDGSETPASKKSKKTPTRKSIRKSQAEAEKEERALGKAEGQKQASDNSYGRDKDSSNDKDDNVDGVAIDSHAELDEEEVALLKDLGSRSRKKKGSQNKSPSGSEEEDSSSDEEDDNGEDGKDASNGYDNSSTDSDEGDSDDESEGEDDEGRGGAAGAHGSAFQGVKLVEHQHAERQKTKKNREVRSDGRPVKTSSWIARDLEIAFGPVVSRLSLKAREQLRVMEFDKLENGLKVLAGKSNKKSRDSSRDLDLVYRLEKVTSFVWAGVAQMRGWVGRDEAASACEHFFAFEAMMLHRNEPNKIIHRGSQTKTYDEKSVLGLPILPAIIGKTFFGKQANASKAAYTAIYHDLPIPLLALVIVSIECCILSFKNGFRKDIQFSDATFQSQSVSFHDPCRCPGARRAGERRAGATTCERENGVRRVAEHEKSVREKGGRDDTTARGRRDDVRARGRCEEGVRMAAGGEEGGRGRGGREGGQARQGHDEARARGREEGAKRAGARRDEGAQARDDGAKTVRRGVNVGATTMAQRRREEREGREGREGGRRRHEGGRRRRERGTTTARGVRRRR